MEIFPVQTFIIFCYNTCRRKFSGENKLSLEAAENTHAIQMPLLVWTQIAVLLILLLKVIFNYQMPFLTPSAVFNKMINV